MRITSFPSQFQEEIKGASGGAEKVSSGSFGNELKAKIEEIDGLQHQADGAMQEGAIKGASGIDETMIQLEQADISLRFLVKVRNKALEAYQEVMRMQL